MHRNLPRRSHPRRRALPSADRPAPGLLDRQNESLHRRPQRHRRCHAPRPGILVGRRTPPLPIHRPRVSVNIHRLHHLRLHRRRPGADPPRLLRHLHDDLGHVRAFRPAEHLVQQQCGG